MGRTVLDVLRREGRPVTLPEVARRIVALRGLDPSSGAVLAAVEGSAGRALRHGRSLGAARNPRKEGRLALWELAGETPRGAPRAGAPRERRPRR